MRRVEARDKIGPPAIMLLVFLSQVFPLAQCRAAAEDYVILSTRDEESSRKKTREEET